MQGSVVVLVSLCLRFLFISLCLLSRVPAVSLAQLCLPELLSVTLISCLPLVRMFLGRVVGAKCLRPGASHTGLPPSQRGSSGASPTQRGSSRALPTQRGSSRAPPYPEREQRGSPLTQRGSSGGSPCPGLVCATGPLSR